MNKPNAETMPAGATHLGQDRNGNWWWLFSDPNEGDPENSDVEFVMVEPAPVVGE